MAIKSSNVAARVEPEIKEKEKAKAILAQLGISASNYADFSNAEGGEADTQQALDIVCTVSINEDNEYHVYEKRSICYLRSLKGRLSLQLK